MASGGATQLVEMLAISQSRAQQLLSETGGDLESAIALHFADPSGARSSVPQSPRCDLAPAWDGHAANPATGDNAGMPLPPPAAAAARCRYPAPCIYSHFHRSELRSLLGDAVTPHQVHALLHRAGGSVAAAADLYFEDPAAAGPASAAGSGRGGGGGRGRGRGAARRGNSTETVSISDSGTVTTEEDDDRCCIF